jgi:hypothetical protein
MNIGDLKVGLRYDFITSDGTEYAGALLRGRFEDGSLLIEDKRGFMIGFAVHEFGEAEKA